VELLVVFYGTVIFVLFYGRKAPPLKVLLVSILGGAFGPKLGITILLLLVLLLGT